MGFARDIDVKEGVITEKPLDGADLFFQDYFGLLLAAIFASKGLLASQPSILKADKAASFEALHFIEVLVKDIVSPLK